MVNLLLSVLRIRIKIIFGSGSKRFPTTWIRTPPRCYFLGTESRLGIIFCCCTTWETELWEENNTYQISSARKPSIRDIFSGLFWSSSGNSWTQLAGLLLLLILGLFLPLLPGLLRPLSTG